MSHSHRKKIYIDRLFPDVDEMRLQHKLKINRESIMYITIPIDALQITKITENHILKYAPSNQEVIITDATAGVGGNTISFSRCFKMVNAIELDQERFNYLTNNVSAYQLDNIKLFQGDCVELARTIESHDVIFIDPPWGGRNYKFREQITLYLSEISLEDICLQFLDPRGMRSIPNLIILKLPKNYNLRNIFNKLNPKYRMFLYELPKMNILVVENGHYSLPASSSMT